MVRESKTTTFWTKCKAFQHWREYGWSKPASEDLKLQKEASERLFYGFNVSLNFQCWTHLTIALFSSHNSNEVWQTQDAWFIVLSKRYLCATLPKELVCIKVSFYIIFFDLVTPRHNQSLQFLNLWSLSYLWLSLPSMRIICNCILCLASLQPFHMFYTFLSFQCYDVY